MALRSCGASLAPISVEKANQELDIDKNSLAANVLKGMRSYLGADFFMDRDAEALTVDD
ncbi:MAG: hypothetical protein PUF51_02305 [Bifidobacteriaceae bacterium]|nr:hypothetical protein [Bifidobacteriaceae bacterium]